MKITIPLTYLDGGYSDDCGSYEADRDRLDCDNPIDDSLVYFSICCELHQWFLIPNNVYDIDVVITTRKQDEMYELQIARFESTYGDMYYMTDIIDSSGKKIETDLDDLPHELGVALYSYQEAGKKLYVGVQYDEATVRYRD